MPTRWSPEPELIWKRPVFYVDSVLPVLYAALDEITKLRQDGFVEERNQIVGIFDQVVNGIGDYLVDIPYPARGRLAVLRSNADHMESRARTYMEETGSQVAKILKVLNSAIEDSRSVDKVNSLTNDILNISGQTDLLALFLQLVDEGVDTAA